VGDKEAEDLVSCIECCLLFGMKGKLANQGSFWGMILDCAKSNRSLKTFQDDVAFCKSLYIEDDQYNIERGQTSPFPKKNLTSHVSILNSPHPSGRAWVRQCLNAGRLGLALRLLAVSTAVLNRWMFT
jgi:hypothetical protein